MPIMRSCSIYWTKWVQNWMCFRSSCW